MDYALVTRVFRQDTRQVLIVAGGLKHFGPPRLGEFVTNPLYWRDCRISVAEGLGTAERASRAGNQSDPQGGGPPKRF